jgi:predicted CopG family antitoxin
MSNLFYVVCIVAIVFTADAYNKYLKMKKQKSTDSDLAESLAKIESLAERIRVLERIVTENKFDLGREIDDLE